MGRLRRRFQLFQLRLPQNHSTVVPYWRLSSLYFFYFSMIGAMSPYWSLYLDSRGFAPEEIGILISAPFLTKLVAPNFWSWLSDRYHLGITVIRVGLCFAFICFFGVLLYSNFYYLLIILLFYGIFSNAILPQIEALTLSYLDDQPYNYSRIRLWGSVGFIATVFVLGIVFESYEIYLLPYVILSALAFAFMVSFSLHKNTRHSSDISKGNFLVLLSQPSVIAFYVMLFFLQFSHGAYYAFYSIYLESLGYSKIDIGTLWALAVASEVIVFYKIPLIFSTLSKSTLLSLSLLSTIVRWILIGTFASNWYVCIFAQILHSLSFAMIHALSIDFIKSTFGIGAQGQAHALYSAVSFGAGASIGSLVAGYMWQASAQMVFVLSAFSAFIAWLIAILVLKKKFNLKML